MSLNRTTESVVRRGTVSWLDHPPDGPARVEAESYAFHALPVTVPEGDPIPHEATPGELLAISHATFLAGFLAEELSLSGTPAKEIVVEAACTFAGETRTRELAAVDLKVRGRVPGIDADAFRAAVTMARRSSRRSMAIPEDFPGSLEVELASYTGNNSGNKLSESDPNSAQPSVPEQT